MGRSRLQDMPGQVDHSLTLADAEATDGLMRPCSQEGFEEDSLDCEKLLTIQTVFCSGCWFCLDCAQHGRGLRNVWVSSCAHNFDCLILL